MSKILLFVKLDFITVKPYLTIKNLFVLLIAVTALSINNAAGGVLLGIVMAFALMYSSYPFAVGEKNGIDQLYATLPIGKRNVVLGRYGFVVALDVMSGIAACIFLFIMQTALQRTFNLQETLLTVLVLFAVYTFLQAIQLPIYFKLGYAKAKFLAYLPLAVFPLVTISVGTRFSEVDWILLVENALAWISDNQFFAVAVSVIVWTAIMSVSCGISLSFYKKREF